MRSQSGFKPHGILGMKPTTVFSFLLFSVVLTYGTAQVGPITSGFSAIEYGELLKISTRQGDSLYNESLPAPDQFKRVYRSPVMGLDNRWEFWSSGNLAAISIRGTTLNIESWVENFYAAMLPASGVIHFSPTDSMAYHVGSHSRASVHAGWLIGAMSLFRDMKPHLDSCVANGIQDIYIVGHSQGGAIAYLLTSVLFDLRATDTAYANIRIKTYASAAPKPGNLYYAHEFESLTQDGWAYNVVNSEDWVPEGPFTIQTMDDYNTLNPFKYAEEAIKQVPFPKNIILKHAFNQMDKPTKKASKKFNKYLGKYMTDQVQKYIPGYVPPVFEESTNYVRTGNIITLLADDAYFEEFPNNEGEVWQHHKFEAYFYLLEKHYTE